MNHDGFEVPIHRSLTEPILYGGVPRDVMILNVTLAGATIVGAHLWYAAPIFLFVHFLAVYLSKKDAQFFDIFLNQIQRKPYYDA